MAADDVAAAVCEVALAAPLNNTVEIAGPEPMRFEDFVRQGLRAVGDQRDVVADPRGSVLRGPTERAQPRSR